MKKRLFLTGDQGCGKSTLIRQCLGSRLHTAGGFLTVRTDMGVELRAPDPAADPVVFLELSAKEPVFHKDRFLSGIRSLLSAEASFAVMDEIGGIELFLPETHAVLDRFFASGTPCIGVVKNPSSAEKLARRLGLDAGYLQAAEAFRQKLAADPDTAVIPADDQAEELVRQWAEEYGHA